MKVLSLMSNLMKICVCMMLGVSSLSLHAQSTPFTVSGTVTDMAGQPVIGAAVMDAQTGQGGVTDVDGKYSLKTSAGAVR